MNPRSPISKLATHEVSNTPPHRGDQNLWTEDRALKEWLDCFGGSMHRAHLAQVGMRAGLDATFEKANLANAHVPELRAFDRYGMRINSIEFHPAYHDLMQLAVSSQLHNFAWHHEGNFGHLGQGALTYMFSQPEGGVLCPMAMTYAAVPTLRMSAQIADEWMPRILASEYDRRDIPVDEKSSALLGMFMTEKQGGSDVRANTTSAVALEARSGEGAPYLLTGHKFFCSAPMGDAFLVLARTEGQEVSCFLVPRWRPDGQRNNLAIQRLKNKLGNRSNASAEIEFHETYGVMVGEEAKGIRTIIEMVNGNRIYCAMSSAGMMRQALAQALHHTRHRSAFGRPLIAQPLMQNVLADMAIEAEAALALGLRVAAAMDQPGDPHEVAMARLGTAVAKYWNTRRCPYLIFEAMECHGGPGYIEDSILPRLYREAPVNSIWEGSGNVIGLDVLRTISREPGGIASFFDEIEKARGADSRLDRAIDELKNTITSSEGLESRMRTVTEMMALTLQGSLLVRHADPVVAHTFLESRLNQRYRGAFGCLPGGTDLEAIIQRASPA